MKSIQERHVIMQEDRLDKLSGFDSDSAAHTTQHTRLASSVPILYLYSKIFPSNGIPSVVDYDLVNGVPLNLLEHIESMGFVATWDNLVSRDTINKPDFIKSCVYTNNKGYMIVIDMTWTPWVSANSNGSDAKSEGTRKIIKEIFKYEPDTFVTKHNTNGKISYQYIEGILVLMPPPHKRKMAPDDITVLDELFKFCDAHDSKEPTNNPAKIHMLMKDEHGMDFKDFDVSKFTPDLKEADLFYGDGFTEFNTELIDRLEHNKKGVVLFHGEPGTGKTHYIRYLLKRLAEINKRIIYVPSTLAESMTDPVMINFLTRDIITEERDTILLIEDAESLLESREDSDGVRSAGVSNLLNATDGLLNDILGLVVIATFNTDISNIDSALLRPGRLLARKEFKKIPIENTSQAANILGLSEHDIEEGTAYTVAELLNLNASNNVLIHDHVITERPQIGFNRA